MQRYWFWMSRLLHSMPRLNMRSSVVSKSSPSAKWRFLSPTGFPPCVWQTGSSSFKKGGSWRSAATRSSSAREASMATCSACRRKGTVERFAAATALVVDRARHLRPDFGKRSKISWLLDVGRAFDDLPPALQIHSRFLCPNYVREHPKAIMDDGTSCDWFQ